MLHRRYVSEGWLPNKLKIRCQLRPENVFERSFQYSHDFLNQNLKIWIFDFAPGYQGGSVTFPYGEYSWDRIRKAGLPNAPKVIISKLFQSWFKF